MKTSSFYEVTETNAVETDVVVCRASTVKLAKEWTRQYYHGILKNIKQDLELKLKLSISFHEEYKHVDTIVVAASSSRLMQNKEHIDMFFHEKTNTVFLVKGKSIITVAVDSLDALNFHNLRYCIYKLMFHEVSFNRTEFSIIGSARTLPVGKDYILVDCNKQFNDVELFQYIEYGIGYHERMLRDTVKNVFIEHEELNYYVFESKILGICIKINLNRVDLDIHTNKGDIFK